MTTQDQVKSYLSQALHSDDFPHYLLMKLIGLVKSSEVEMIAEEYMKRSADSEGTV
tara:strand:+ start:3731 stop:3898 length:168 start_codon:yes stop_codon:yes gene_type:complete